MVTAPIPSPKQQNRPEPPTISPKKKKKKKKKVPTVSHFLREGQSSADGKNQTNDEHRENRESSSITLDGVEDNRQTNKIAFGEAFLWYKRTQKQDCQARTGSSVGSPKWRKRKVTEEIRIECFGGR
jgi:hypothetical protein